MDNNKNSIDLDKITFLVPCQRFNIKCAVTKDERLPIVNEFVIRLLKITGKLTLDQIQKYFGFNEKEIHKVIQGLLTERLIAWQNDELVLTEYANSKFKFSNDGLPRFVKIEEWNERFSIDLISFNFAWFQERSKNYAAFIELTWKDEERVSQSIDNAIKTFENNFIEYVEKFKYVNLNDRERFQIYKISAIEAGDRFFFTINLNIYIDVEDQEQFKFDYPIFSDAEKYKRSLIIESIADSLSQRSSNQSKFYLKTFAAIYNDIFIPSYIKGEKFELKDYLKEVLKRDVNTYEGSTQPIIGAAYLEPNLKIIDAYLNQKSLFFEDNHSNSSNFISPILWIKPKNDLWGKNDDVFELAELLKSNPTIKGYKRDKLILFSPKQEKDEENNNFIFRYGKNSIFDRILFWGVAVIPENFEIILCPYHFVVALYHHIPDPTSKLTIPFGIVSREPKIVSSFQQYLYGKFCCENEPIETKSVEIKSKSGIKPVIVRRKVGQLKDKIPWLNEKEMSDVFQQLNSKLPKF